MAATNHNEKEKRTVGSAFELVLIVAVALALAFAVTHFVAQPFKIPSESMEQTIMVGDRVISEKISTRSGTLPDQGDIITFKDPEDSSRTLIKRVIAVEGQTVDFRADESGHYDGLVYVDGVALDEPYTAGKMSVPLNSPVTYPYTVPDGCVWVMGDNRTNSKDSRYFGAVDGDDVTGVAVFTYWPVSSFGKLE